ncbi:MAG: glycosyl transferase, partial [Trinickia sp.]
DGSESKLNTYRDGFRILTTIAKLFKAEKPLLFFSIGFFICTALSIALAVPLFETYVETGLVPRLPTSVLCAALVLFGAILLTCGIVLDTVTRGRTEAKRFAYLSVPGPRAEPSRASICNAS